MTSDYDNHYWLLVLSYYILYIIWEDMIMVVVKDKKLDHFLFVLLLLPNLLTVLFISLTLKSDTLLIFF